MGKALFRIVFALFVLTFIGIQYIEVDRTNPQVKADLNAPLEIKNIFKTACYDCHSYETKWPWYSKVAPISWLVVDDVNEGRKHLNFSEWGTLYSGKREELKKKIWEQVATEEMPLTIYTYLHPDAKLELSMKNIIKKWAVGNSYW
jgi:hypothetical protein